MSIHGVIWYACLSGFHTVLLYQVLVQMSLFHYVCQCFCEVVNYLHRHFTHCSFSCFFDWHCLCYCLMCFLAVYYSYCFMCQCCLTDHSRCKFGCYLCWLHMLAVPGDQLSCLCYMYCVWSVVVVMVTLSCYCTMGPWSTLFALNHYSRPYWNESIISGSILVLIIFVCLFINAL